MVQVGDIVRMTGVMPNDPAPLEVGDSGPVTEVLAAGQILVEWKSGRRLILLRDDPFEVVEPLR